MAIVTKLPLATQQQIEALDAPLLRCDPGPPIRCPAAEADAGAPDWCCPACARKLIIGLPPKYAGLMLECGDCLAVGIVPPATAWPRSGAR